MPTVSQLADIRIEDDSPFLRREFAIIEDSLACLGVDNRPDEGLGLVGRADLDGPGSLDKPGQEGVVDSLEDDDPGAGRAFLAGVPEGTLHHAHDGLVEVGVVIDDDRVLARPSRR